ncbi:L-serine ammonia-lyase, iron-sulfur-dependent subunit beta [Paramaledivibacter caminithermalis]|jgi:L-serine dehydratase|uniref:L-serine deaminase n=1 Tax=Paramaledivibacter caminithermalis (strain DSM 15212 / CIP 107654 / DViRD3) TaxID=1121301 RepID=A0A1M6LEU0_PARC5|nr:L-serine ammonia-lyase, iron-sulfur-dependent subunit beta [Paramaledivibacter caminithermalis]SHJ69677.1 L-serine ammonia-lyase [Paramaledivibacter caminithermalis DSM 15212]
MKNYSAFEIIGPKMIGPSSSHTAGAARLGRIAGKIANYDIKKVKFILHGSFSKTYKGHGTDRALMAGILGMRESDEELKNSLKIAEEKGIDFEFIEDDLGEVHPNTVKFHIEKSNGEEIQLIGSSIGGGNIKIIEINGLRLEFTGQYPTIITRHLDYPGIIAKITKILAYYKINIAFMSVYRQDKGQDAFMVIETDNKLEPKLIEYMKNSIEDIKNIYLINSI